MNKRWEGGDDIQSCGEIWSVEGVQENDCQRWLQLSQAFLISLSRARNPEFVQAVVERGAVDAESRGGSCCAADHPVRLA